MFDLKVCVSGEQVYVPGKKRFVSGEQVRLVRRNVCQVSRYVHLHLVSRCTVLSD